MPIDMNQGSPFINLFRNGGGAGTGNSLNLQGLANDYTGRTTGWTIHEAYLGLLVATALVDGNFHDAEQQEVLKLGQKSPVLSQLSMSDLATANNVVNERFQNRPEALKECCETLPREMRLAVLGHCVEVAVADGSLNQSEVMMIERIIGHMGADPNIAKGVVEVVLMMAQY